MFNAYHWFWLADDGRIFSSKQQALIASTDPDYVAWLELPNEPTPWPRDDAGNQTDAALQAVLDPYQTIFVNDEFYARHQGTLAVDAGYTTTGLASAPQGMPTLSAQHNRSDINISVNAAQADAQYTANWIGADGNFYPLTNNEIIQNLGKQLAEHMNACRQAYIDSVTGVRTKTLTTRKEIDELFAKKKA
jgi:hypothetical protein